MKTFRFLLLASVMLTGWVAQAAAPPAFKLTRWKTGEAVSLQDFAGQVVVLDFFAYWCGPCKKASREMEASVGKFYREKKGNPNGVPVRLLSVTIEQAKPELTDEFIKELGLEMVVSDPDGMWMEKFGFAGAPSIVVIDGTRAPEFRIVYRYEGYEGTKKVREAIDAVKPVKAAPSKAESRSRLDPGEATGAPVQRRVEVSSEGLLSKDIRLTSSVASFSFQQGRTELKGLVAHLFHDLEYEPFALFDFLGYSERVREHQLGGQLSAKHKLGDRWSVTAGAGLYEGFTDFRSLWLARYYQQQFGFFPGYVRPDPAGFNGQASLRWEYQPASGFVEAGFGYSNDRIAPGWEMDPVTGDLHHGREFLHTYAPSLKFENVWTSRIRTLQEFLLASTSGRDPRFGYRGSVNVALGERWVVRGQGGYTYEEPQLRAWFLGATLEYELTHHWTVGVQGRHYRDTGEIENSFLISTAAPGIETFQAGLMLRYLGDRTSFSFLIAPMRGDYELVQVGTQPFANLYRDRTWILAQASVAILF